MSVGTITSADGNQYVIELFRTDRGAVEDVAVVEEEELTAAGVDGRRWRTVGNRYRPFTATILQTCLNYVSAVGQAKTYDEMIGTLIGIDITLDGAGYTYPDVHVTGVRMRAMPGKVAGAANAATHNAYVVGELDLVVVEQEAGANP
jgi:hypothetical protein